MWPSTVTTHFKKAAAIAGRSDLRFHDLRHTGATLAAASGATLAELMQRLGHTTVSAALAYQHAAQGSDKRIAANLSTIPLARGEL
jgi:integrase